MNTLYRPLLLDLVKPDRFTRVAMYVKSTQSGYVLYKAADTALSTRAYQRLVEAGTETIYLLASDIDEFYLELEENLAGILADPQKSVEDKGRVLTAATTNYVADVFEVPTKGLDTARSKRLVDNIMNFAVNAEESQRAITAIVAKDYSVFAHCVQVAALAIAVQTHIGLIQHHELLELGTGALLHDFGFTYLPPGIIAKKAQGLELDEAEELLHLRHTEYGYETLKQMKVYGEVTLSIVKLHHTRLDGSGYPEHVTDKYIPRSAQIVAACDYFSRLMQRYAIGGGKDWMDEFLAEFSATAQGLNQRAVNELLRMYGYDISQCGPAEATELADDDYAKKAEDNEDFIEVQPNAREPEDDSENL